MLARPSACRLSACPRAYRSGGERPCRLVIAPNTRSVPSSAQRADRRRDPRCRWARVLRARDDLHGVLRRGISGRGAAGGRTPRYRRGLEPGGTETRAHKASPEAVGVCRLSLYPRNGYLLVARHTALDPAACPCRGAATVRDRRRRGLRRALHGRGDWVGIGLRPSGGAVGLSRRPRLGSGPHH